jgi:hypothetical protein
MALTLAAANLARQQTYMFNLYPGVFYELKALFDNLAFNLGNPNLQLVNIDGTAMSSNGGAADQVIANVACHLYAIYVIKRSNSVATSFKTADSSSATAGDGTDIGPNFTATTNETPYFLTFPAGRAYANGITLAEDTTATGTTDTLKLNRMDGFAIIGA